MKLLLPAVLGLTLINCLGCKKESLLNNGIAYYQFSSLERIQIPGYRLGDTLIYKNQSGASMIFGLSEIDSSFKMLYTQGMGFFTPYAASYFYYDAYSYRFWSSSGTNELRLSYRKWPVSEDSAKVNLYKLYPARTVTQLDFPFWNGLFDGATFSTSFLVPEHPDTFLQVGRMIYPQVARIITNNPDRPSAYRNVNILYYAYQFGIVGFDDWNGNEWRLQR